MGYVLHWADLLRYYVVVVSLLLIALLLRMAWARLQASGGIRALFSPHPPPHVLSLIGFCVMLVAAIVERFDRHGMPPDKYLWIAVTAVTLVGAGVLINFRFTLTPPWRRNEK